MAQQFTYRVECEGAPASPAPPQQASRGLPPCLGDPATSFWTNCVGTYTTPSGQKFVGEFRDDKKHGQGTHTFPEGDKYVGEYKDGKMNGKGSYTYASGAKYVGEFRDDKQNGQGTNTFPDGAKYVGEYRDGKRNGLGTLFSPSGRVIYSGQWVNGERVR